MKKKINVFFDKKSLLGITAVFVTMAVLTIMSIAYFNNQLRSASQMLTSTYEEYHSHYAFITDNMYDAFWLQVYQSAKKEGQDRSIEVERFGENSKNNYTKEELLTMAIASSVDGIILQGDESEEIRELISQAEEKNIPVVTVVNDAANSARKSFVGISSYDLGKVYGREIIRIASNNTRDVLILTDKNKGESSQHIIYTSIKETIAREGYSLDLEIEMMAVDNSSAFSAEEVIRDIFLKSEELPDILICLNEKNTISAYQAVVDYNNVGRTEIIGYYTSDTILKAIEKNVVAATITVDSDMMGKTCIDTLDTYMKTGHVTDYTAIDVKSVNAQNVGEYVNDDKEETRR